MRDTAVEVIASIGAIGGVVLQIALVWAFFQMYRRLRQIDERLKEMAGHTSKVAHFAEMGATDQRRWYEWQAQVHQREGQ